MKKDRGLRGTGNHMIWDGKPLTSGKKGWRAQGTGSHVIWDKKPLTSGKRDCRLREPEVT